MISTLESPHVDFAGFYLVVSYSSPSRGWHGSLAAPLRYEECNP